MEEEANGSGCTGMVFLTTKVLNRLMVNTQGASFCLERSTYAIVQTYTMKINYRKANGHLGPIRV